MENLCGRRSVINPLKFVAVSKLAGSHLPTELTTVTVGQVAAMQSECKCKTNTEEQAEETHERTAQLESWWCAADGTGNWQL